MPQPTPTTAELIDVLQRLRAHPPLVHCLTNGVVKNFTANALLALGAAPAMVEHPQEAEAFAAMADALLVNVGTLGEAEEAPIRRAVPSAVTAKKPWVLDPVAVGPLAVRTALARDLVAQRPAIIRGNASEIIALAGMQGKGRGVDSGDPAEAALDAAKALTAQSGGVVLVTGPVDYATDGQTVCACHNGHPLLTRVTGVGCAQGAIVAACTAVAESPLVAALAAAVFVGVAGEVAAERAQRPGSFQIAFLDALDALDADTLNARTRLG
ncbi:MAG: hydroxyethylthiazole kinase [Verrucomicrobiota bacterium JB022]|nr:hydroxyethylthiazole kinase [Verrucomicrobiota bacterium JB022]